MSIATRTRSGPWPWYAQWFPAEPPGPQALAWHVLTGHGGWWTDRPHRPRALLLHCGPHRLLRGDPQYLDPALLPPLACGQFTAPDRFLPLLARTYRTFTPWRRLVYVQQQAPQVVPVPPGFRVRPLGPADAPQIERLAPGLQWILQTWGDGHRLVAGGHAWGAFTGDRLAALACIQLRGYGHEDLAVVTAPEYRRLGLALACVTGLTAGVRARGRVASWTVPQSNEASRALAVAAGFRPVHQDVAYGVGSAS